MRLELIRRGRAKSFSFVAALAVGFLPAQAAVAADLPGAPATVNLVQSSQTSSVQRWSGADRYATSVAVSQASYAPGVKVAFVASGTQFPDALSGAAVAGTLGGPVLLTSATGLPGEVATELGRLRPGKIVVLGGVGAVSSSVAALLAGYVVAAPPSPDVTPPGPVTHLSAALTTGFSVGLSWTNPTDSDFRAVTICRKQGGTPPASPTDGVVLAAAAPGSSYVDVGLAAGQTYSYAVFAVDTSGNVSQPASVTTTTVSAPTGIAAPSALPILPGTLQGPIVWASPTYFEADLTQNNVTDIQFYRMDDGSFVRNITYSGFNPPQMVGTTYLTGASDGAGGQTISINDVATGANLGTLHMPAPQQLMCVGAGWALAYQSVDQLTRPVTLYRVGQQPVVLAGMNGSPSVAACPSHGDLIALPGESGLTLINISTATVTNVAIGAPPTSFEFGTNHIYWSAPGSSATMDRVNLDGTGLTSIPLQPLPLNTTICVVGDQLMALTPGSAGQDLRPVDPATGALGAPLVSGINQARADDGSLALALNTPPTGRFVSVSGSPAVVHDLGAIPPFGGNPSTLAMTDGAVFGDFGMGGGNFFGSQYNWPVQWTPASGGGTWSSSWSSTSPEPAGSMVGAAGDTVLSAISQQQLDLRTFRLSWPGGYREFSALSGESQLGRGGDVVELRTSYSQIEFHDVRTGALLAVLPGAADHAIDGHILWTGPDGGGTMTAHDLTGQQPDVVVNTGLTGCNLIQQAGRFAILGCRDGHAYAVDLHGVLPPLAVPTAGWLGDGFFVYSTLHLEPDGTTDDMLHVIDLAGAHSQVDVGPSSGVVAVDDLGTSFVYATGYGQIDVVHPTWLSTAP